MGIDPSYLSQLLTRSMTPAKIEQLADAAGVDAYYFDEYVAKSLPSVCADDPGLLEILRLYVFEVDDDFREQFRDVAKALLKKRRR
jgi:transcriptional regulator with XRE-family HTH domain